MTDNSIFDLLSREEVRARRRYHQGLIIQPGALGDCILTLPFARFMQDALALQSIDIVGHSEHISIFPGRTCVSKIRSMEAIPFHRLFVDSRTFEIDEQDPLIPAFAPYEWIATFLGGENTDFEQNLIYAANCTSGTEVTSLDLHAPDSFNGHIAEYYIRQFVEKNREHVGPHALDQTEQLIAPMHSDLERGGRIFEDAGLTTGSTVIIQPGSGGTQKNWPLDNFISVAAALRREGLDAAFLIGPAEVERLDVPTRDRLIRTAVCLSGLALSDVVAVLSQAFAFLGNDSGITHLAASMATPTTVVLGPAASSAYRPIGPAVTAFEMSAEEFARDCGEFCQGIVTRILNPPGR